ncbi:flagellar biosynthesis anti-sigma factor FlgM [Desulfosporosinus sp. SB140]|uniref:flagellar biosynthesis anti-sigma factor FlgM n=1 Tax=Desulfosporosinus paludis TaxID=3115649 RepID=UPI00388D1ED1
MKIDPTSLSVIKGIQATNRINQVGKKKTSSEGDKLAVSDKGQTFQTLLQKAKDAPSVREDKVRTLSEQIERGEFQVNGQTIAENILSPKF